MEQREGWPSLSLQELMGVCTHAAVAFTPLAFLLSALFGELYVKKYQFNAPVHPDALAFLPDLNHPGYMVGIGVIIGCILLTDSGPRWLRSLLGAVVGTLGSSVWWMYFRSLPAKAPAAAAPAFLAVCGSFPGLVFPLVYHKWLAVRRPQPLFYLGGAILAGTAVAILYAAAQILGGVWAWSPDILRILTPLWISSTLLCLSVNAGLYAAHREALAMPVRRRPEQGRWVMLPSDIWRNLPHEEFRRVMFSGVKGLAAGVLAVAVLLGYTLFNPCPKAAFHMGLAFLVVGFFVGLGIVATCILLRPALPPTITMPCGFIGAMAGGILGGAACVLMGTARDVYTPTIADAVANWLAFIGRAAIHGGLVGVLVAPMYSVLLAGGRGRFLRYLGVGLAAGSLASAPLWLCASQAPIQAVEEWVKGPATAIIAVAGLYAADRALHAPSPTGRLSDRPPSSSG